MACKFVVNGQESLLYNNILEAYNGNEELAIARHSYFKTDSEFLKNFGDWVEDFNREPSMKTVDYSYKPGISRIEDNGEPKLFKNEKNGNYYYIDKDKNKVEIIENTTSLKSLFNNKQIESITKVLVNNYFKNHLNIDFENINLNTESVSIRESIIDKLNERIDTFRDSGNDNFEDIADLLEIALDENLDELVKNVVNSLETYKIKSSEKFNKDNEDSDLANIEINENEKDPGFGRASYEMSTKGNISANVKLRLSLIVNTLAKDNFLNDTVYLSFDEVYSSLLPYLTNQVAIVKDGVQEDKFEILKSEVLKLENKKPYFKELYRLLSQAELSEEIKNEFVQAFSLDMNNFNTSEYSYKESTNESDWVTVVDQNNIVRTIKPLIKTFKNINVSETGKKETDIFNEWNKNFKSRFVTETKEGSTITKESKDKLKVIQLNLNKIKYNQEDNIKRIVDILRDIGVENTTKGFQHFIDDLKLINNDNELSEKIFNKAVTDLSFFVKNIIENKNTNYNNILSDQNLFKQLAKAESFYISEGSDASVFTAGKQKWVYSYPSYLSNTIKSWKKDRNILLKHYEVSKFNEGSDWMKYLLALDDTYQVNDFLPQPVQEQERIKESQRRINDLDIYTFNTSQEEGNSIDGKTNKDISKAEYISDTINKLLGFTVNRKTYYRTTTPADKGTQLEISINRYLKSNARYGTGNRDIVVNEEVINTIFNYFDAEYKRMKFELEFMKDPNNADKLRVYYHTDRKGSVGMHFDPKTSKRTYFNNLADYNAYDVEGNKQLLGHAFKSQLFPSLSFDKITDTLKNSNLDFKNIYDENGNAYLSTLKNSKFESDIKSYIANELSNGIQETLDNLIKNKIFEETSEGIVNKELDDKIWSSYGSNNALKASADFFINSLISHVEYSKMFAGDVAYYKNAVDYKKRVPATYTDGLYQRLNNDNKNYTIASIESVEIDSPFLPEITELLGETLGNKYKDINSADAQAWISPNRWKDLMQTIGKWNATYESAYNKLIGDNNEPFTLNELKAVAPPLKGVYFQVVDGVPIFLKYSQAVLSPRLRKGNGLEKIYNQMVSQEIDELVTFDAIKVGSNKPIKIHNIDGSLKDNFQFEPFSIPSNGWKLQQDLPIKTMHDTEVGSQIQKNIFQGLAFNLDKDFTLDNESISGNQVIENIANVVGELSNLGYESVLKEFGVDSNGVITNLEGFYNSIVSELKSRGGSQNIIDALESEISIYGVAQAKDKLQNIFSSILTKRMLKIKTNGGSFIQMSNFGLYSDSPKTQSIIWSPRALKTTHEPQFLRDEKGKFILSENGKKIIRPGGILISGSFIAKYIPDYHKYKPEQLFGYTNENGEFVNGIIDRKILENIVGYRIPNQGLSSNDALEIVGILPEENGDTVVAYTGITTKTGSDYDIDKMYLMFPSFKPQYNINKKLRNYVYKNLRGKTKLETIDNINAVIDQINPDYDTDFNVDEFSESLLNLDISDITDEEDLLLKDNISLFVDIILKTKKESPLLNYIKEETEITKVSKLRYENYDNSKPDSEQTKAALQNRLIELYKSVLLNENVIGEVMTPVDFDYIKNDIRSIAKVAPTTNLSTFNQLKDIDVKYSFLAGKAGVGQQANALMDYVLGSLANLSITNFNVPKSNLNLDQEYSQELSQSDLDYYAKELNLSKEQVNTLKSVKISNSLSAILNAFVDIAKDPYITEGNWVTMTTNTGNLLLRKGVHPFYVNAFLAQPVIKEYVEFSEQYESSDNQNISTSDEFIKQKFGKDNYDNTNKTNIFSKSLKDLRENVIKNDESFQMDVFNTFLQYQAASKAIKTNIDASKFMVNGVGGSINSLMIAKNAVDSILDAEDKYNNLSEEDKDNFRGNLILGFNSKFTNPNGSESMFSKYYKNVILKSIDIVKSNPILFLEGNETIQNTFNEISKDINNEILLDNELGKQLGKTFYSYIMSGFQPLKITSKERRDLILNFPKEFETFKNNNSYIITEQITVKPGDSFEFVGLNNRKKSKEFEESMINSFLDLLNDNEEFANKLIKYSYLTSGFNNTSTQFFNMIPTQWFSRNNINRYIIDSDTKYKNYNEDNDVNFIDQFYLSNLDNRKFVKNITDGQIQKELKTINGFVVKKPGKVGYYRVKKSNDDLDIYYKLIGYNSNYQGVYTRFIPNINSEFSEIKPLNVRDKKGNRIVNFDTNGINLKAITETNPEVAKSVDKKQIELLNNEAVISRDIFYRENIIIKKDNNLNESKTPVFDTLPSKSQGDQLSLFGATAEELEVKPKTEYIFDNEDDAIAKIEGQKKDGTFGGKQLPTGTIIKIKDSYFTVKNEVNEDIDLIPLKKSVEDDWQNEDNDDTCVPF
jgi:hypothetical protein